MFFKWCQKFLLVLFGGHSGKAEGDDFAVADRAEVLPPVHFHTLKVVDKTPGKDSVVDGEFIAVVYQNEPYWAMFRCPCGCQTLISLSLQKVHNPNWEVQATAAGRPTLKPSVWQNRGCYSHFWIRDGRIFWCSNTGVEPWLAEPLYYSKPQ